MKKKVLNVAWMLTTLLLTTLTCAGCPAKYREDLDYGFGIEQKFNVDAIESQSLAQFESVGWDPDQIATLSTMIVDDQISAGRDVLEIGTGTGVIAVLCLLNNATRVVATDPNPAAVANAKYNAARLELDARLDVRPAAPDRQGEFPQLKSGERFDLIIRHAQSTMDDQVQIQDFLEKLLVHLKPGGRCIVSCASAAGIDSWKNEAQGLGYQMDLLGDRNIDSSSDRIYPALLMEIRIPTERYNH